MGCAASKGGKKKKKGTKDKKGAKKKSYGKKGSPDALRREITDIYSVYKEEKKKVDPFLSLVPFFFFLPPLLAAQPIF